MLARTVARALAGAHSDLVSAVDAKERKLPITRAPEIPASSTTFYKATEASSATAFKPIIVPTAVKAAGVPSGPKLSLGAVPVEEGAKVLTQNTLNGIHAVKGKLPKADGLLIVPGTCASGDEPVYHDLRAAASAPSVTVEGGVAATSSIWAGLASEAHLAHEDATDFLLSLGYKYAASALFAADPDGVAYKVRETYRKACEIIEANLKGNPKAEFNLTLLAHSRGGVVSLQVLQELRKTYPADRYPNLKLSLLAIDPVAGPTERQEYEVAEGCDVVLLEHIGENRPHFPPLTVTSPEASRLTKIPLPIQHSEGLGRKPDPTMQRMMTDLFLSIVEGSAFDSEAYRDTLNTHYKDLIRAHNATVAKRHDPLAIADISDWRAPPASSAREAARKRELEVIPEFTAGV